MTRYRVDIRVLPRPALLDPQGKAVQHALAALGFAGVDDVRVGKALSLAVEARDTAAAEREAHAMCERLLANPVTEDFVISVVGEM
ncbi:MAG: phosphoribosylformylglycinamidine synthase subunit PurS [Gemmatimonadetes bacterium]|nr:phosphoribosylformylglycinamidine synthase subunit PurS [Gemmatimonadota bacterium]